MQQFPRRYLPVQRPPEGIGDLLLPSWALGSRVEFHRQLAGGMEAWIVAA